MSGFIFASGIENSYPVITGGERVDQMQKCGHYDRWRDDLRLTKELGISHLRIGPAYYLIHESPGVYRWENFDDIVEEMRNLGIEPIIDLLHFGLPEWQGNFQNRDFPAFFAEYAGSFASRYPHIRFYTPVNEILITARFSAKYGWWNEQLSNDRTFVTALKHLIKANLLAMHAIRRVRQDAVFVQSESFEYWHTSDPSVSELADLENEVKFVPLDLTYGVTPGHRALEYLMANGFSGDDFDFIGRRAITDGCVIGIDYYETSEQMLQVDGSAVCAGDILGLVGVCRDYFYRYNLPMMHTETNMESTKAVDWLKKQWLGVMRMIRNGVPVLGFTWFSLIDQMDWDTALREPNGHVCTVGLADLDRKLRPVGEYYRDIISTWRPRFSGIHAAIASSVFSDDVLFVASPE